jgi:iron(III) transport system substrate-binding protein
MLSRAVGCLSIALVLAACQPSAPVAAPAATGSGPPPAAPAPASEHAAAVQRLVDAARENGETELSVVWNNLTLGGAEGARRFEALFNRQYATNIRIVFTPGPPMPDMALRIGQEVAAGRKTTTDAFLGTETHIPTLIANQSLEEFDYTTLSPRVPRELLAPRGVAVEIVGNFPGITYNTDLVSDADVPQKLEDVLHPKWKGRIASTDYAAQFERVAIRPEWGAERMKGYISRLSQHVGGLVRVGELSRLLTGEFAMLVLDSGSNQIDRQRIQGAPLRHVIPSDAAVASFLYIGVPRTAAHPNLAKLYVNMLLSEEGQQILYDVNFADHYALPGSRSALQLEGLRAKGVELLKTDVQFLVDHPELHTLKDDLARILREGSGNLEWLILSLGL